MIALSKLKGFSITVALATILVLVGSTAHCSIVYELLLHIHGEDTSSHIGRYIQGLGDVNGDGFDDIAVYNGFPQETMIYYGGINPDTIKNVVLPQGKILTPADHDGDGIDDFAIMRPTIGLQIFKGYGDSIGTSVSDSIPFNVYRYAYSGNIGSDVFADYLVESSKYSSVGDTVALYESPYSSGPTPAWVHVYPATEYDVRGLGFIDFNCDGHQDIFVGLWPESAPLGMVDIFYGPVFPDTPSVSLNVPATIDTIEDKYFVELAENIGDFNGDGWEDLGVRFKSLGLIYLSESGGDLVYDYSLEGSGLALSSAGDVNGDGWNDLIGELVSFTGGVGIYLGGPSADGVPDAIIVKNDLPPFLQDRIGHSVARAGDLDNDGIDEIFFGSQNFAGGEAWDVWLIRGSNDIVTDVSEIPDETLPKDYSLFQNYPNPFNPSTNIEFEVPGKSTVLIKIFNLGGQLVRTLVDKVLTAGHYEVAWDGKDETGGRVASGMYFCRLQSGGEFRSTKMVLLK